MNELLKTLVEGFFGIIIALIGINGFRKIFQYIKNRYQTPDWLKKYPKFYAFIYKISPAEVVSIIVTICLLCGLGGYEIHNAIDVFQPVIYVDYTVKNTSISVYVYNLPKNKEYEVYIASSSSSGKGIPVTNVLTDAETELTKNDGTELVTDDGGKIYPYKWEFSIPKAFEDEKTLEINFYQSGKKRPVASKLFINVSGYGYQAYPVLSIISVIPSEEVSIELSNVPPGEVISFSIGKQISAEPIIVKMDDYTMPEREPAVVNIPIPLQLQEYNGLVIMAQSANNIYLEQPFSSKQEYGSPKINIADIDPGKWVKITVHNFSPDTEITGKMGEYGFTGIVEDIGTVYSTSSEGIFTSKIPIPDSLADLDTISIHLENENGDFANVWFKNLSSVPATEILAVATGSSVTIRTYNFPVDQNFVVTMGKFGTRGVAGYIVDTVNSGDGGSFDITLPIPTVLNNLDKIAVRFESAQGYYAYDWFEN